MAAQSQVEAGNSGSDEYRQANIELGEMIRGGRSFSGRERHCAFLNTGGDEGARFACISASSGIDFKDDGRGLAQVDWDLDGDVDVLISNRNAPRVRFLRNDSPRHHRFLALRLEGAGPRTNRDAIGARVEVTTDLDERPQVKTLRAGEGFLSQSSKWLHFGLGQAERVSKVVVRWPNAAGAADHVEEFEDLAVDCRYQIRQGAGVAQKWMPPERKLTLAPSPPELPPASDRAVLHLPLQFPMLHLPYQNWDGGGELKRFGGGRAVLVNLWATWCAPCVAELEEFKRRSEDLLAAGVDVLALSVDGMGDEQAEPGVAAKFVGQHGFEFASGQALVKTTAVLQQMHDRQMPMHRSMPLPSSFLVDADGRLIAIYKGPVAVDQILDDLANSGGTHRERFMKSALRPGRMIEDERLDNARERVDTIMRFKLATTVEQVGRLEEALTHYTEILKLNPGYAEAHNNLGSVSARLRRFAEAEEHLQRAIELKPEYAEAHHNLGNVMLDQGWATQALGHYRRAVELAPERAEFYTNLGRAEFGSGEIAAAAQTFQAMTKLTPQSVGAFLALGQTREQLGQVEAALAAYGQALELAPDNDTAAAGLIRLSGERGERAR